MIKAEDLRIGNYITLVYDEVGPLKVEELQPGCVHLENREYMDDERDITGVEISPSWLKNAGFAPRPDESTQKSEVWKKGSFLLESNNTHDIWRFSISGTLFEVSVKWVHQLQNLLALIKDLEESADAAS